MNKVNFTRLVLSFILFLSLAAFKVQGQTNAYANSNLPDPTVTSDKDDYSPGEIAHIIGAGWTFDDSIHVEFKESPDYPDYHIYDLAVNADGSWQIDYAIEDRHLGVTFTVTAQGKTTAYIAQTIFTDGINKNPDPATACVGGNASFGVTLSGNGANSATYQWQVSINGLTTDASFTSLSNGGIYSNVTSQTLNLTGVTNTQNNYLYRCVAVQSGTSFKSTAAKLTVIAPPTGGTTSPAAITICNGAGTTITLVAGSFTGIIDGWQSSTDGTNWVDINNKTTSISPNNITATTYYRAVLTNGTCTSNSSQAIVSVHNIPTATVNTSALSVCSGSGISLILGGNATSYNWTSSFSGGASTMTVNPSFQNGISSPLNASVINNTGSPKDVTFTITPFANGCSGTAVQAVVTVNIPVAISGQPVSKSINVGNNTTFSVTASGNPIAYQWQVDKNDGFSFVNLTNVTPYSTVTTATLNITAAPLSLNNFKYRCVVTGCNQVLSTAATLTVINPIQDQTITFTNPGTKTFGNPDFTLDATATSGLTVTFAILSGPATVSGSTLHITGAGSVSVRASQAGNSGYNPAPNVDQNFTVNKASSSTIVTINGGPFTYSGLAQTPATVSVTGAGGLNLAPAADYVSNINAGTATASYIYAGDANHEGSNGSKTFDIAKADPAVTVTQYNVTYDGNPHTATYSIAGVNGETDAMVGTVDVSGTTHTDAGTYTNDPWTLTGTANYNNTNGSVNNVIDKADPTIIVTPYNSTYNAIAHTATGSAKGVQGEILAGLDLSGTTHTNAGTYTDTWLFIDVSGNYNDKNATVSDLINKADAIVSVNGYAGVYDAAAHGATGAAIGVDAGGTAAGTTLDLGASFTDVPGGTANWTFTGGTNYNDETGSVNIIISKADALVTVNGFTGVYDAAAHGATGTATGVGGIDLSGGLNLGSTFTDVPGGTANWIFSGGNNYNNQSGTAAVVITKADALVTINGYTGVYDAAAHGATGTATGVGGIDLSGGLNLGSTFTNVPGGTANWTFNGGINYKDQSGTAAVVISKKAASVTPNTASKYCGQVDPPFSGVLNGFLENVTASYSRTAGETAGGSYLISAILSPTTGVLNNYAITYNTAAFTINGITSIDASLSSKAYPVNTPDTISAGITPAIPGVSVTFKLDNGAGLSNSVITVTATTDNAGVATYIFPSGLPVEVYKVIATAGVNCATSGAAYLAVYDPNGGFVTGGGWIMSPAGAYYPNVGLSGKANFGFNSKYKKGSNVPDGNTEFQFQTGNLNFSSTSYTTGSLVIAGAQAIYKGVGTINGIGGYSFMVSAVDGQYNNGTAVDKFRIKIWNTVTGEKIYDNMPGASDNATATTEIGGGSIVIHNTGKSKPAATPSAITYTSFNVKVLGNPSATAFKLKLESNDLKQKISMRVVDETGRVIEVKQNLAAGQIVELTSYKQGLYFAELVQGDQRRIVRLVKIGMN
jgi:hypothetical protein